MRVGAHLYLGDVADVRAVLPVTTDAVVDALEGALAADVPCDACDSPAVWRGLQRHLRRQPLVCQAANVCKEHRVVLDAAWAQARIVLCDLHAWPCERVIHWRAL